MSSKHNTASLPSAIDYYDAPPRKDSPPSAAPSDITLAREIQLLRWMIRWLARHTGDHSAAISRLLSLLFRAVTIELSRDTSAADLRAELEEAGERVLRMLEAENAAANVNVILEQEYAHLERSLPAESYG